MALMLRGYILTLTLDIVHFSKKYFAYKFQLVSQLTWAICFLLDLEMSSGHFQLWLKNSYHLLKFNERIASKFQMKNIVPIFETVCIIWFEILAEINNFYVAL